MGEPLIVDRMQARQSIPGPTFVKLRAREQELRRLLDRLASAVARSNPTQQVQEAYRDFENLLSLDGASAFVGLLRRPPSQQSLDGPELRALERYLATLELQASDALAVDALVADVQRHAAAVRTRFTQSLPWTTHSLLVAAGLTEEKFVRLRRRKDAERLAGRAAQIETKLEALAKRLDRQASVAPIEVESLVVAPTLAELALAWNERAEARRGFQSDDTLVTTVRQRAAEHLASLGTRNGWDSGVRMPVHLLAEQLVKRSVDGRGADSRIESGLWFGMLRGANLKQAADASERSWQADRVEVPHREPEVVGESTLFVVPINDTFAYVSRDMRASVRVRSRAVRVGKDIEVRLAEGGQETIDSRTAELDVQPLFEGIGAEAAWYRTGASATLTIIAEAGQSAWYAHIKVRGKIVTLRDAAWRQATERTAGLRILAPATSASERSTTVGSSDKAAPLFTWCGIETHEVRAPFADVPVAWLRLDANQVGAATEGLERERRFFDALLRSGIALGLRPVGNATKGSSRRRGNLYAPPLALPLTGAGSSLDEWMDEGVEAKWHFVRAIARTIVAVHSIGYALVTPHKRGFAFAPDFLADARAIVPTAVVIAAPHATVLGTPLSFLGSEDARDGLAYDSLGFAGAVPGINSRTVASPVVDAVTFALLALDLLARSPVNARRQSWMEMLEQIDRDANRVFGADRQVATGLVERLADQTQWHLLMEFLTSMAHARADA
jgi:hypothetical protein